MENFIETARKNTLNFLNLIFFFSFMSILTLVTVEDENTVRPVVIILLIVQSMVVYHTRSQHMNEKRELALDDKIRSIVDNHLEDKD